jgi:prevent-host-death family protein
LRTACETSMGLQLASLANLRAKVVSRFNVHDAKSNLSRLLTVVERGEEVTIMRDGEPVADLVPHRSKRAPSAGSTCRHHCAPGGLGQAFN